MGVGDFEDQGDGVVAAGSAAVVQCGLLDGIGDACCGQVAQAGEDVAEPVFAVDAVAGRAAGLGDAVGEQHQAVTGAQQPPRESYRPGSGRMPSRVPGWPRACTRPSARCTRPSG